MIAQKNCTEAKPTICQVLHSLDIGGAEVLAAGLARSLRDRYRFVFACLDGLGRIGQQLQADGFHVEVLERQDGVDWKCGFRLGRFLKEQHVDAIHAHQYTPYFQSMVARLTKRSLPIAFTEHGRHFPDSRSFKRVAVNRLLSHRCDRFIGVGKSVRQALIDNEGLPAERVEVIYNGVNLRPFQAVRGDRTARDQMRASWGVAPNEFAVVQVARLNPLKDHVTAIRAVAEAVAQGVAIHLILVGEGETRSEIEHEIEQLGVSQHVRLLGARQDIPQLLVAADAFLLSSISEGIPLTLIEAMAAGVPVVSTDVGGNSEVVIDNQTGLLCPARNVSFMAQRLVELRDSQYLRNQLVENAALRAEQLFDIDQMHAAYVNVYDSFLNRNSSRNHLVAEVSL